MWKSSSNGNQEWERFVPYQGKDSSSEGCEVIEPGEGGGAVRNGESERFGPACHTTVDASSQC